MKTLLRYLLVILLISSCKRKDKFPAVHIFGHAAAGLDMTTSPYEENTIEAIEYALSYPEMSGIEVDIQWSKNGTLWLFHDEFLETQTSGDGCLRTKTDEELDDFHFKGINKEELVRLNDIVSIIANRKLILDLKIYGCGQVLTNSEFENPFIEFNSLISNTEVSVIVQDLSKSTFFESLGWKVYLEVQTVNDYINVLGSGTSSGCAIRNTKISKEEVSQIQNYGKEVIIFDARSPKTIRQSLKKAPNGFLADDIKATLIEKIK